MTLRSAEVNDRGYKEAAAEENELRERALLYVCATRAKRSVLVTSFGDKSRLL